MLVKIDQRLTPIQNIERPTGNTKYNNSSAENQVM